MKLQLGTVLAVSIMLAMPGSKVIRAQNGQDSARGNVNWFGVDVDFSARSNFNGTEPQGRFRYSTPTNTVYEGQVTCLNVVADIATLAGIITSVRNPTGFAPQSFVVHILDSGKFNQAPDMLQVSLSAGPPPAVCPASPGGGAVLEGEIVVKDSLS